MEAYDDNKDGKIEIREVRVPESCTAYWNIRSCLPPPPFSSSVISPLKNDGQRNLNYELDSIVYDHCFNFGKTFFCKFIKM